MTDIVTRLCWTALHGTQENAIDIMREAADEIERLTAERDDARAAQLAAERTNAPLLAARTEIERLTALAQSNDDITWKLTIKIERLTAALEQAVDDFGEGYCVCEQTKQECIRALRALEPKPCP